MKKIRSFRETGSVLLATMIFVIAIAAFLVSYLLLVQNSNQTTARAQQWNSALALAEAGIEEGLANLNMADISSSSNAISFSPILGRQLNGGRYSVISSAAGVVTTITSTGVVSAPITGDYITRIVQITAQRQALFTKGMIAMTTITMNGNGVISDSYNSHDPSQSTNGLYSGYAGTNGDIAAVGGFVNLGNHTIAGNLYLGPGYNYAAGPNGGVTGTVYPDWNVQFPTVSLPTNDASGNPIVWTPAPGSATSHSFTNAGYYLINDDGAISVEPGVKVILQVARDTYNLNNLNIKGGTTNSGTIIMYQNGNGGVTLGGNASAGAINNRPENFVYYGLPGITYVTMSGNSTFVGIIYAPQAAFTLSGGGAAYNFIGSLLAYSITINGQFNLHYDESIEGLYWGFFVPGSWQELSPP